MGPCKGKLIKLESEDASMVSAIEAARLPFATSGPSASAAKNFRFPEDEENRSHLTPIGCKDVEDGGRGFEPRTSVVVIIVVVVIVVVVVVVVVVIIVVVRFQAWETKGESSVGVKSKCDKRLGISSWWQLSGIHLKLDINVALFLLNDNS